MGFRTFKAFISHLQWRQRRDATPRLSQRVLTYTILTCFILAIASANVSAQSRTPFLDLLPSLKFSDAPQNVPLRITDSTTAQMPVLIDGIPGPVDLREQPYFSIIYSSCLQQNVDLDLRDSAGHSLVQSPPLIGKVRLTLPKTGGFPRLWTVSLTNSLVPNVDKAVVASLSFLDPNPRPPCLEIQALGFSESAPSSEPKISIATSGATNNVFFYNGYLRGAPTVDAAWTTIPSARNNFQTNAGASAFFTVAPFALPIPPVNLDTNFGSAPGGYMSVHVNTGFSIIANQLRETNTVSACLNTNRVMGTIPNGSAIIKLDEAYSFVPTGASNILDSLLRTFGQIDPSTVCMNVYENGAWTDPNQTLAPGEAVIFYNPADEFTVYFIGSALSGTMMNYVPAGLSLRAGMLNDVGGISTLHGYQPSVGDTVTRFSSGTFTTYTFTAPGVWDPSEPVLHSGEGVLINAKQPTVWTRFFSMFP
jgi:hypothetical protein